MSVFAIIDTNVLVSAMMKPQSVPGQVVKESLNGQIIPVVNWEIMDEYKKVLRRLKFGFDPPGCQCPSQGTGKTGGILRRQHH